MLMPGMIWPGTGTASLPDLARVELDVRVCAAIEDPVEASDIEDPEDENGGSDLSDGDGDGGFR